MQAKEKAIAIETRGNEKKTGDAMIIWRQRENSNGKTAEKKEKNGEREVG